MGLRKDMAQHGLRPQTIAHAIQQRYDELIQHGFTKRGDKKATTNGGDLSGSDCMILDGGYVLGRETNGSVDENVIMMDSSLSPRERALRAAEERAKKQQQQRQQKQEQETKQDSEEVASNQDKNKLK